jgi:hypothetical protein
MSWFGERAAAQKMAAVARVLSDSTMYSGELTGTVGGGQAFEQPQPAFAVLELEELPRDRPAARMSSA